MTHFTTDNTEGFTAEELTTLNDALAMLLEGPGGDSGYAFSGDALAEQSEGYGDLLNNVWKPGMSAEALADAVRAQLGSQ